jgi:hypothetical protein
MTALSADDECGVIFTPGTRSLVVKAEETSSPAALLSELGLPARAPVIAVVGSADGLDTSLQEPLIHLFAEGLVRPAVEADAVIMDGGTASGAMAVLGRAVATQDPHPPLLGVAPAGRVTYPGPSGRNGDRADLDPCHSHFVLADSSDWGGETALFFNLAAELAGDAPVIVVVVGGGSVTRAEVLRAVRRGWPVIIVEGSGGLADELAAALVARRSAAARRSRNRNPVRDPGVSEMLADGDFDVFPLTTAPAALARLVGRRLRGDETLRSAWEQFAVLDHNAGRHQWEFRRLSTLILGAGVIGTLLVVAQERLNGLPERAGARVASDLHYPILLVPIVVTALIAASGRFKAGNKWVVLRGAAEAVRAEIYRYRCHSGVYGDGASRVTREQRLADRLAGIGGAVMKSDVNRSALRPYGGPLPPPAAAHGDDGYTRLSAERYLDLRVEEQARWYGRKSVALERKLRRLRWAVLVFGGVGTFVAAIGQELWIALTTALAGAATTHLDAMQVENTLVHYNQAAADLAALRAWWIALPPEAQLRQANFDRLVGQSERIMRTEQTGWVSEMEDAMTELRRQQAATADEAADNRSPGSEETAPKSATTSTN